MIKATNKHTGEIIELEVDTYEKIIQAWQIASEYEKVSKTLKDQLKKLVPDFVTDNGTSPEYNGVMFRVSNIQRMNYDKSVLREVLDEDTYDLMVKPNKTLVDKYLIEIVRDNDVEGISTRLRDSMIPEGKSYQVIKLERLGNEGITNT